MGSFVNALTKLLFVVQEKEQEAKEEKKIERWSQLGQEEISDERDLEADVKAAQGRKSFLGAREDYKQKRLQRILEQKEKAKDMHSSAPSMEEVEAKPGLNDIRQRALVQKDETIQRGETKDSYI